ncbi:hypothetical protein SAMN02910413_0304 [Pseudobutyrivibrio sp. C4]|uniref:hypothetical protein n=1 Tax=Pseudobutyrivibrio sp. C4 TaxID=1520803 RepID=UPI0008CE9B3E|nr:hypothetical protein [Pseudobutyrivibrio sp. C4]SES65394.1 hypothetical protein SAMN02910413_0304 [Pseudobutyrivibrio sp. C4]
MEKKDFAEFINRQNWIFAKTYADREHIYYYYKGHYYWTMDNPVEETIILNRCNYKLYEMCYSGIGGKDVYEKTYLLVTEKEKD